MGAGIFMGDVSKNRRLHAPREALPHAEREVYEVKKTPHAEREAYDKFYGRTGRGCGSSSSGLPLTPGGLPIDPCGRPMANSSRARALRYS